MPCLSGDGLFLVSVSLFPFSPTPKVHLSPQPIFATRGLWSRRETKLVRADRFHESSGIVFFFCLVLLGYSPPAYRQMEVQFCRSFLLVFGSRRSSRRRFLWSLKLKLRFWRGSFSGNSFSHLVVVPSASVLPRRPEIFFPCPPFRRLRVGPGDRLLLLRDPSNGARSEFLPLCQPSSPGRFVVGFGFFSRE